MASEIRVDKINSLSGVGTVTLSPTGVDIAGITTAATLKATTGIVTTLTATTGIATHFTSDKISLPNSTNGSLNIGVSSAFKINHNGTDSFITEVGGGDLYIQGSDIIIRDAGTLDKHIEMTQNGAVDIYHDNSKKFETTTAGVSVTGSATVSGDVSIADKIIHTGDTNTSIRFPAADIISFENGGSETARFSATNQFSVGTTADITGANVSIGGSVRLVNPTGQSATISALPSGTYNTGVSGGSAIVFHRFSDAGGGSDEIAFETHHQGTRHAEAARFNKSGNLAFPSGQGIDFSATANAGSPSSATSELFDDYEEGTWIPGLSGSDGITGQTYHSRNGFYTKIGERVYCDFSFVINAKGNYSGTYIQLVNLPFPIRGSSYTRSNCTPIYFRSLNQRWCFLGLQGHEGQSKCYVFGVEGPGSGADGASNRSYPDGSDIANSTEMTGSFSYLAA